MADVVLQNVVKRFGDVVAVADVTLTIQDRERVVFVGPSGCGKTTTLRMIAGLEKVSSGDIVIGGRRVNRISPADRNIAMVFQNFALYPHMTVFDNIAFSLQVRKLPKQAIRPKVEQVAALLGIERLLHRRPWELSGGQKQRVALGRAIVRDPAVLLMDEPLSNLDAKLRVLMRGELKKLTTDLGTTTIYVTHDQVEAMTMGDRIVVMNDGKIQQVDTPDRVYGQPANLFVAGMIGSPPMNLFEAEVKRSDGQAVLVADQLEVALLPDQTRRLERSGFAGGAIVAGIRPEALQVGAARADASTNGSVRAVVEVTEPQGADTILDLRWGPHRLAARVEADAPFREGDQVQLAFDPARVRLFDRATERLLA